MQPSTAAIFYCFILFIPRLDPRWCPNYKNRNNSRKNPETKQSHQKEKEYKTNYIYNYKKSLARRNYCATAFHCCTTVPFESIAMDSTA
jgi:hypothetical protein